MCGVREREREKGTQGRDRLRGVNIRERTVEKSDAVNETESKWTAIDWEGGPGRQEGSQAEDTSTRGTGAGRGEGGGDEGGKRHGQLIN